MSLPSSMCLPFIHYCSLFLHLLVLNYMGTTSGQLSGYGNHFTDVLLKLEGGRIQKPPLLMSLLHFFFCLTLSFCLFLLKGTEVHNTDGELVSGTSHVLWVDATMHYLSDEHLPFAITAYLTLFFTSLPPIHLILYPCKAFKRCLSCCHKSWHAMHTFVEAF